jgi:hypothetical protein
MTTEWLDKLTESWGGRLIIFTMGRLSLFSMTSFCEEKQHIICVHEQDKEFHSGVTPRLSPREEGSIRVVVAHFLNSEGWLHGTLENGRRRQHHWEIITTEFDLKTGLW